MEPRQSETIQGLLDMKGRVMEDRQSMVSWLLSEYSPAMESEDEVIEQSLRHMIETIFQNRIDNVAKA